MENDSQSDSIEGLPGCGMGLYAIVLMLICGMGLVGMCGATVALMNSEPNEARNLVHGSEVQVWRLQPMRDAQLLKLTQVPMAWHDESPRFDGTTSCVVTEAMVARLENGNPTQLKWDEITATEVERTQSDKMTVSIVGKAARFSCHFGPNEGADRFLRMIESERQGLSEASEAN